MGCSSSSSLQKLPTKLSETRARYICKSPSPMYMSGRSSANSVWIVPQVGSVASGSKECSKHSKYCHVSCQTYSRSNNWCISMVHPLDFACRVSVDCRANKLKWKYKNNCKIFSSANMISINSPWNWVGAQSRPLLVNHVRRGCMQQTRSCCSLNLREKCCILTGKGKTKAAAALSLKNARRARLKK